MFSRWLFAHCTVNFSWETSVELYSRLASLDWPPTEQEISDQFQIAHSGFHNGRPGYILVAFKSFAWDPGWFVRAHGETWPEFRARVMKRTIGLGLAKTSFALELIWPGESQAVCFDRHMFRQVFGLDASKTGRRKYEELEVEWVSGCAAAGMAPAIARLAYWDHLQGYSSPYYWACVFEREITNIKV